MASRLCSRICRSGVKRANRSRDAIKRCFSSSNNAENICDIPLSEPLPDMPAVKYAVPSNHMYDTQVTVLENGLTVASENKFGQFCTVGVLTDSGSRYEVAHPSGISHFLEKLAFTSTTKFQDRDAILQELENHGGICDCQSSRDTLIHAISADVKGLPKMIDILSEVVLRPNLTEAEIEDSRMAIQFELESLNMRPDPEPLIMEMIHTAAYRGNTLGLPKICPAENIYAINKSDLLTYMNAHHTPNRMVLAGVGIPHEQLVETAREYFLKKTPIWEEQKELIDSSKGTCQSVSQYTGGECRIEKDLSSVSLGPTPMPELAHVVIGLESCSHKDPDFVAFCVLNMLMGGGGSFSAGGPGKGMYTRLYLNVLNRHHWMFNATAYNHSYNDSGVFCIHASSHPSQVRDLVEVIVREMVNMAGKISPAELNRAKTQLQSMLMMNLESRPVVFEDVGRQVLANEHRQSAKFFFDKIGEITADDIQGVANRLLRTKVSVAALGDLSRLPDYDHIQGALASRDRFFSKRFSLFR